MIRTNKIKVGQMVRNNMSWFVVEYISNEHDCEYYIVSDEDGETYEFSEEQIHDVQEEIM